MKFHHFSLALLFFLLGSCTEEPLMTLQPLPVEEEEATLPDISARFPHHQILDLDVAALHHEIEANLAQGSFDLFLNAGGETPVSFTLREKKILADDFRAYTDPDKYETSTSLKIITLKGHLTGDPASTVMMLISPVFIIAQVEANGSTYNITPLAEFASLSTSQMNQHVLHANTALKLSEYSAALHSKQGVLYPGLNQKPLGETDGKSCTRAPIRIGIFSPPSINTLYPPSMPDIFRPLYIHSRIYWDIFYANGKFDQANVDLVLSRIWISTSNDQFGWGSRSILPYSRGIDDLRSFALATSSIQHTDVDIIGMVSSRVINSLPGLYTLGIADGKIGVNDLPVFIYPHYGTPLQSSIGLGDYIQHLSRIYCTHEIGHILKAAHVSGNAFSATFMTSPPNDLYSYLEMSQNATGSNLTFSQSNITKMDNHLSSNWDCN